MDTGASVKTSAKLASIGQKRRKHCRPFMLGTSLVPMAECPAPLRLTSNDRFYE